MDKQAKWRIGLMPIIILSAVSCLILLQYYFALSENKIIKASLEAVRMSLLASENTNIILRVELNRELKLKQKLLQEKSQLEDSLKAKIEEASRLELDIAQLKQATADLKQENARIKEDLTKLAQEKSALEEKMHSIEALKKAIADLRRKMRSSKLRPVAGNRGYITKDGKPTYPQGIVEVVPAP